MSSLEGQSLQCQHCGRINPMSHSLPGFSLFTCPSCGLSNQESSYKMQDELANMFTRNMNLSSQQQQQQQQEQQQQHIATEPQQREPSPITYSISQHYHHSAHVVANNPPADITVPATEPSASASFKELLVQNNIDPSTLLSSQLTLFEQAPPDQRSRLIELWRISPPEYTSYSAQELADELGSWQNTTVEQEEEMARIRYERKAAREQAVKDDADMDQDIEVSQPETYASGEDHQIAEPYIKSGYEVLAERDYNRQAQAENSHKETYSPMGLAVGGIYQHAYDPAFGGREWWRHDLEREAMENQYGMFDEMSQFRPATEAVGRAYVQEDEEML